MTLWVAATCPSARGQAFVREVADLEEAVRPERDEEVLGKSGRAVIFEAQEARVLVDAPIEPGLCWHEEDFVKAEQGDRSTCAKAQPDDDRKFPVVVWGQGAAKEIKKRNQKDDSEADQALREIGVGVE